MIMSLGGLLKNKTYFHINSNNQHCLNPTGTPVVKKDILDVVIVGAGLAGLGAAVCLNTTDLKWKILEAQSYIGGRVLTASMNPFPPTESEDLTQPSTVDVGAQWLHGIENKLFQLATRNNLLSKETSDEGIGRYIKESGIDVDACLIKKVDHKIGEILTKCQEFISSNKYPQSVEQHLEAEFMRFVEFLDEMEGKSALEILDWHRRFQVIDNACLNLSELSAKFWGAYSNNGERSQGHINIRDGFGSIIKSITEQVGMHRIETNRAVSKIHWNVLRNMERLIRIETVDGKTHHCRHVIITISLGVLKNAHDKIFSPKLPDIYCSTIHAMGFGNIEKIYMQFSNAWWENVKGFQLIYAENISQENAHWSRYISGFDVLSLSCSPNTLVAWVGGLGAKHMYELSDTTVICDCIALLAKFLKTQVPFPVKYYCSRWGMNPYIQGGYSFISTKCDTIDVTGNNLTKAISVEDLPPYKSTKTVEIKENQSEPMQSRPLLLFAGEGCHRTYFSTAHGAFESGFEQAEKILNYYSQ